MAMTYARRRIGIPLVMVWALAQGMWIGAGWHASSQFKFTADSSSTHSCSCAFHPSSFTPGRSAPVVNSANAAAVDACPFCVLGALAPDVPVVAVPETVLPTPPLECVHILPLDAPPFSPALPPSRAPPVA